MSITRDFDAMIAERTGEKPTFRIAGQEFTLRARLPFTRWDALLTYMRADETGNLDATRKMFSTVLVRADRERFLALLTPANIDDDDDESGDAAAIGLDQLGPLTDWVMEYFTGKLQSNTDSSSPGVADTGAPPRPVSLSALTTPA